MVEELKYLGEKAQNAYVTDQIAVLVPIALGTDMNVAANKYMNIAEWGSAPADDSFSSVVNVENILKPVPTALTNEIKEIQVCKVTTDTGVDFEFGTKDIMESMASMCQCYIYPMDESLIPTYPYKTARMVCEELNPQIASDPLMMIALCDVSLMSSDPGVQFTSYLRNVKNGSIPQPSQPEDIYDWYYREDSQMLLRYEEINELARKSFLGILRDPDFFKDFRTWIENAYTQAIYLRSNDRYFLINLLRKGKLHGNSSFKNLLAALGTPLLRNNAGFFTKIPLRASAGEDVEYFQSIRMLIDILSSKPTVSANGTMVKSCSLLNWCFNTRKEQIKRGHNPKDIVNPDSRCFENPTTRSSDKNLCPVARLWYAMELPPVKFA